MGVYKDERCKRKPWYAFYWCPSLKKRVSVGSFVTEAEAQDALRKELLGKGIETAPPEDYKPEEKKPVNLKFGTWR